MNQFDFNSLLPEETSQEFKRVIAESPYRLLIDYSNALNKKYKPKLKCIITESYQLRTSDEIKENIVIALNLEAAIGKGYLYRLLEIEQLSGGIFPVQVKVFQNNPSDLGKFDSYSSFESAILKFLNSGFVKTLILNLLAQVDLYNESRNEKFTWEEKV